MASLDRDPFGQLTCGICGSDKMPCYHGNEVIKVEPPKAWPPPPPAIDRQAAPTGEGEVVLHYAREKVNQMIEWYHGKQSPVIDPDSLKNLYFDLGARAEMGLKKYGTYLRTNNGRSATVDLFQELMDAVMYSAQARMEGKEAGFLLEILISLAAQVTAMVNREKNANQESR